jgi:predicted metal-dependent hydrolase
MRGWEHQALSDRLDTLDYPTRLVERMVKHLFLWHVLEESEDKAVAFDVYRAVGGSERTRVVTMKLPRYGFGRGVAAAISRSRHCQ